MDEQSMQLASALVETVGRNSSEWVSTKIQEARGSKKLEDQQVVYEGIIRGLLEDKTDLESVARQYKELYESVTISDDDIDYLQETLHNVVNILNDFVPQVEQQQKSINALVKLINKDTLKTMQLLGFNYKEAIGTPLTEACAHAIQSNLGGSSFPDRKG